MLNHIVNKKEQAFSFVGRQKTNFVSTHKILKPIHNAAIICSAYAASKQFYTEILGLSVITDNYRAERDSYKSDLRLPNGNQLELFSFPATPKRLSYPEALGLRHLAFSVDDIEQFVRHLQNNGIAVEPVRLDEYTGKAYTFFSDPDGLPLELHPP